VSESTAAVAFLGVFFFFLVAAGPVMMFFIRRGMPWGICQRLQRGWPYVTSRTTYTAGAWNPARPLGPGNDTPNEPGRATYTLPSDGLVHILAALGGLLIAWLGLIITSAVGRARQQRAG